MSAEEATADDRRCRCGCKQEGVYIVEGVDMYDAHYREPACIGAAEYLSEASVALKKAFKMERAPWARRVR